MPRKCSCIDISSYYSFRFNSNLYKKVGFGLVTLLLAVQTVGAAKLELSDISRLTQRANRDTTVIVLFKDTNSVNAEERDIGAGSRVDALSQQRAKTGVNHGKLDSKINQLMTKRPIGRFRNRNLGTLQVNPAELSSLIADPQLEVYENRWHKPMLDISVPLVFETQAISEFSGSGQVVVLLDTGVEKGHDFLNGRIIDSASACFSNSGMANGGGLEDPETLCSGGMHTTTGIGAGDKCDPGAIVAGCQHGTQIAGIIASNDVTIKGVATGAQIIPIQVFTQLNDEIECGDESNTPCILASTIDIIRALEYVDTIKTQYSIAAVNLSFGSSITFQGICDGVPEQEAIDSLVASNIAVIAASGNNGETLSMTSPACISNVIAVAATDKTDPGVPFAMNNRNSELDLFAPGVAINTSSLPSPATTEVLTGTSAAAAHVSAAWAILKQKNPSASIATIKGILQSTGPTIQQGSIEKRRLDITQALAVLPKIVSEMCFPIKAVNGNVAVICL